MQVHDLLLSRQSEGMTIGQIAAEVRRRGVKVSPASLYVYAAGHREPSKRLASQLTAALEAMRPQDVTSNGEIDIVVRVTRRIIANCRTDERKKCIALLGSWEPGTVISIDSARQSRLHVGDSTAIWRVHQTTANAEELFDSVFNLLAQFPGNYLTFRGSCND